MPSNTVRTGRMVNGEAAVFLTITPKNSLILSCVSVNFVCTHMNLPILIKLDRILLLLELFPKYDLEVFVWDN